MLYSTQSYILSPHTLNSLSPENVFAGQLVHASAPVLGLNLPATQARQPSAFEPVKPKSHRHIPGSLLPATATALALQATHVALDVAASAVEYESARQSVHGTAPVIRSQMSASGL